MLLGEAVPGHQLVPVGVGRTTGELGFLVAGRTVVSLFHKAFVLILMAAAAGLPTHPGFRPGFLAGVGEMLGQAAMTAHAVYLAVLAHEVKFLDRAMTFIAGRGINRLFLGRFDDCRLFCLGLGIAGEHHDHGRQGEHGHCRYDCFLAHFFSSTLIFSWTQEAKKCVPLSESRFS